MAAGCKSRPFEWLRCFRKNHGIARVGLRNIGRGWSTREHAARDRQSRRRRRGLDPAIDAIRRNSAFRPQRQHPAFQPRRGNAAFGGFTLCWHLGSIRRWRTPVSLSLHDQSLLGIQCVRRRWWRW